jgi:hypothetical protein
MAILYMGWAVVSLHSSTFVTIIANCAMSPLQRSTGSDGADAPTLIVLCTWTAARDKYIDKYKYHYQQLFPNVEVKVIKTSLWDLCFRSSQSKQKRVTTDVDDISAIFQNNGRVLLHAFSDGGSNKACELADAYLHQKNKKMPIAVLYLDSTPGAPRFNRLCKAASKSFPPIPLLKPAAFAIGVVIVSVIWIYYCIVGFDSNTISTTRKRLLSKETWDLKVPRCYLLSKTDEEIYWQDVQSHARNSIAEGAPTTEVLFEGTDHVSHARLKPKMYWNVIHETWKSAVLDGKAEEDLSSVLGVQRSDFTIIARRTSSEEGEASFLIQSVDGSKCVWKSQRDLEKAELESYWDTWRCES